MTKFLASNNNKTGMTKAGSSWIIHASLAFNLKTWINVTSMNDSIVDKIIIIPIKNHCIIPVRILVSTNFPYGATDLTPKTFPNIAHKTKQIVYPQPILKSNETTSLSV